MHLHRCLWKGTFLAVSFLSLSFFLQDHKEEHLESSVSLQEEKKKILHQLEQRQISSEGKNHKETFREMQKRSLVLQRTTYRVLAGVPPQKKKLLTVGISAQPHHGRALLDTLQSLFQASSASELNCIVVLVLLPDPDPEWLHQTVTTISSLFQLHIEAQELLVIHGRLSGSPVPEHPGNANDSSPCAAVYSRQKVGYALLMNFAPNLSEYFLMIEDQVQCTPKFVSTIYWALLAWKERPWVTLEFSSLSFSGKVFQTRDLARLTEFLLLFPKDTPTHLLLLEFRLLLAQHVPIRFTSSLFRSVRSYPASEDTCFPVEKEPAFDEPDNPVASVLTDMTAPIYQVPEYAYVLNKECYATLDPLSGNYLTVVFEEPQKVTRIEVLTGSDKEGQYWLQQGQVELGYDPLAHSEGCARYVLLGPLVEGHLDQRVFYEEGSLEQLSCIRLVVLASQDSWMLIRQIRVWTQPEEEEPERHPGTHAGTGPGSRAYTTGKK